MRETKEKNPYCPIMVNDNEPIALIGTVEELIKPPTTDSLYFSKCLTSWGRMQYATI